MIKKKKVPWPKLPIHDGSYKPKSVNHVEVEANAIKAFNFGKMINQKNDPRQFIEKYFNSIVVQFPYAHYNNLEEEEYKRDTSFQKVQEKIGTKNKINIRDKQQK